MIIVQKKFYEFNKDIERKYRIEIRIITDGKEYIKHRSSEITKIVVVDNDLEYLNRIQKEIEDTLKVSVTKSHISNIEICNFGISKGIALEKLADYYNIPIEKCIAVGNDENDISMIKKSRSWSIYEKYKRRIEEICLLHNLYG